MDVDVRLAQQGWHGRTIDGMRAQATGDRRHGARAAPASPTA